MPEGENEEDFDTNSPADIPETIVILATIVNSEQPHTGDSSTRERDRLGYGANVTDASHLGPLRRAHDVVRCHPYQSSVSRTSAVAVPIYENIVYMSLPTNSI